MLRIQLRAFAFFCLQIFSLENTVHCFIHGC
ncbi:hypothetical protein GLYMA_01G196451v4 [Glycine max]|nr:hypothetical protein GLYMA_01G196451v4 [Glycine max]KAH1163946.1 hypothetical protein GYH30_002131 [Glycine max]